MIIGKLTQQGELKLSGGIDTRLPLVADGLVAHYPMDGTIEKYFPKTFRYIRDWCNGNTINTGSHWVEIQAIDYSGVNLALNGTATSTKIIDDVIDTVSYYNRGNILAAVIVDLLDEYSIKDVIVYHWYSDGRSYYDTKTEVSEDGVTWYSIFDSAIEGIYAEPLDGTGKTHNLQNLGTTVNPITNTGTTITNDYVAVEEATTNVIPDGDFTGGLKHPYAYANNAVLSIVGNFEHGGYMLKHATTSSGTDSYSSGSNFPLAPAISGDTWTTRIFARATRENTSVQLFLFGLNVSNSYVDYGAVGKIISPSDGWVELTYTRTFTNAAVVNVASRIDVDAASTVVYWRQWQLEKKAFATEYVNGSRSTAGYMTYSADNIDRTKGTIHLEAFITSQLFSAVSYIDMLNTRDSVGGGSNDFIMIRKSAGQVLPTQMFLRSGGSWIVPTITSHIIDNAWNTFTWTWDTTTGYSLTVNGTIVASAASYTQTDQTYDILMLQRGWSIRNLSIYNRALSDSEVTKLANGTHSFTQDGLITKSINTTGEIRYIRDYLNGSTANTGNHWVEIKANTQDGTNVALGKVPTSNVTLTNGAYLTNGVISSAYVNGSAGLAYVQIDLGSMQLIDNIQVWHYYPDGRTYYGTRTQVSHDGIKWYDVFNSATQGTYAETINGVTHYVGGSGATAMKASATGLATNGISTNVTLV